MTEKFKWATNEMAELFRMVIAKERFENPNMADEELITNQIKKGLEAVFEQMQKEIPRYISPEDNEAGTNPVDHLVGSFLRSTKTQVYTYENGESAVYFRFPSEDSAKDAVNVWNEMKSNLSNPDTSYITPSENEVYERGEILGVYVIDRSIVDSILYRIRTVTGAKVAWYASNGNIMVKAIRSKLGEQETCLSLLKELHNRFDQVTPRLSNNKQIANAQLDLQRQIKKDQAHWDDLIDFIKTWLDEGIIDSDKYRNKHPAWIVKELLTDVINGKCIDAVFPDVREEFRKGKTIEEIQNSLNLPMNRVRSLISVATIELLKQTSK